MVGGTITVDATSSQYPAAADVGGAAVQGDTHYLVQDSLLNGTTIREAAGQGNDTLDFSSIAAPVTFTVQAPGTVKVQYSGKTLTAEGIENLVGGSENDVFIIEKGGTLNGFIDGLGGRNTLQYSGSNADRIVAFSPVTDNSGDAPGINEFINIQIVQGGDGIDAVFGDRGDQELRGGANDDILLGGDDDDMLLGEGGDDQLGGEAGDDTLSGGAGNDIYNFADAWGADTVNENGPATDHDTLAFNTVTSRIDFRVSAGGAVAVTSNHVTETSGDNELLGQTVYFGGPLTLDGPQPPKQTDMPAKSDAFAFAMRLGPDPEPVLIVDVPEKTYADVVVPPLTAPVSECRPRGSSGWQRANLADASRWHRRRSVSKQRDGPGSIPAHQRRRWDVDHAAHARPADS